jgi:hypothetical protein
VEVVADFLWALLVDCPPGAALAPEGLPPTGVPLLFCKVIPIWKVI